MTTATAGTAETVNGQHSGTTANAANTKTSRNIQKIIPSDDEILGLVDAETNLSRPLANEKSDFEDEFHDAAGDEDIKQSSANSKKDTVTPGIEAFRDTFEKHPELKRAWEDAEAYRENFATPEEARSATALLADLNRIDGLFYSRAPEDHAELARSIAELDPAAFSSLARAMGEEARRHPSSHTAKADNNEAFSSSGKQETAEQRTEQRNGTERPLQQTALSSAQANFFQSANAAAVQGVLEAIESQVERLLPEGASKSARNRVTAEIYRELDTTLRDNRQLAQQVRDAFRSGTFDAGHQRAVVSLITGRARQALPGAAKRVMNEWTSTVIAANEDRRSRQRAAEKRIDIAGSSRSGGEEDVR